jgi:hypothetical protein
VNLAWHGLSGIHTGAALDRDHDEWFGHAFDP